MMNPIPMNQTPAGQRWGRQLASVGALIAWVALGLQLYETHGIVTSQGRGFQSTLFVLLGYFTILTNILSAWALSVAALAAAPAQTGSRASTPSPFFMRPSTVGGIAVSMTLVGLVYNLVLRQLYSPVGIARLADELLHVVMPLVFLLYAWLCVCKTDLQWRDALIWAIYPLVYLVYALVRGALFGPYPYPFIDVAQLGYKTVLMNSVGVCVVFMAMSLLFIVVGRWNDRKF